MGTGSLTRYRGVCKKGEWEGVPGDRQKVSRRRKKKEVTLTPFSIMAILSARRAVVSRWVIQITVLTRSPDGSRDTSSIVSNISFWACASSADVYMGYTRSGTGFSKMEAKGKKRSKWIWTGKKNRKESSEGRNDDGGDDEIDGG